MTKYDHYIGCMQTAHAEEVPQKDYPWLAEPKVDGYRMLVHVDADARGTAVVRGGATQPYNRTCKHIVDACVALGERDVWYDGELQARGGWKETSQLVRLKAPTDEQMARIRDRVCYVVFDLVPAAEDEFVQVVFPGSRKERRAYSVSQRMRRHALELVMTGATPGGPLQLMEQVLCQDVKAAQALFQTWLTDGAEGAVFKQPSSWYVFDRHPDWTAIKPVATLEGVVTAFQEGEGKHVGRLGALICRTDDGVVFGVGTGFTNAQREEIWLRRTYYIGHHAEVKVEVGQTAAAVRNPRFLRWRLDHTTPEDDYETLPKLEGRRVPLAEARTIAQSVIELLRDLPGVQCVELAGSVRRECPTVSDVDLLLVHRTQRDDQPDDIQQILTEAGWEGSHSLRRKVVSGVVVDVRLAPPQEAGAAWMHMTGPRGRNTDQRSHALAQGMRLDPTGLWNAGRTTRLAGATEAEIYAQLGLPFLAPFAR